MHAAIWLCLSNGLQWRVHADMPNHFAIFFFAHGDKLTVLHQPIKIFKRRWPIKHVVKAKHFLQVWIHNIRKIIVKVCTPEFLQTKPFCFQIRSNSPFSKLKRDNCVQEKLQFQFRSAASKRVCGYFPARAQLCRKENKLPLLYKSFNEYFQAY